jgi:hypothetical protein
MSLKEKTNNLIIRFQENKKPKMINTQFFQKINLFKRLFQLVKNQRNRNLIFPRNQRIKLRIKI